MVNNLQIFKIIWAGVNLGVALICVIIPTKMFTNWLKNITEIGDAEL